jgi:hypothetical protein
MTIHRVLNLSLPDLNRALELIQKQTTNQLPIATKTSSSARSSGGFSISVEAPGASGIPGADGADGADGIANLDLIVMSYTETEDIITQGGEVVTDQYGWAITDIHTDWDIVEDEYGVILTAE